MDHFGWGHSGVTFWGHSGYTRTYKEFVNADEKPLDRLMSMDNVSFQTEWWFREELRKLRTMGFHGPKSATHVWQPLDRGLIQTLKLEVKAQQDTFLMTKRNWKKFPTLTASERNAARKSQSLLCTETRAINPGIL